MAANIVLCFKSKLINLIEFSKSHWHVIFHKILFAHSILFLFRPCWNKCNNSELLYHLNILKLIVRFLNPGTMYSFVTKQIMKGSISYIKTSLLFDLFTKNLIFFYETVWKRQLQFWTVHCFIQKDFYVYIF